MFDVPAVSVVTIPVPEPIVPAEVLLLVHVPPGVESLRSVVELGQIFMMPEIIAGNGLIVAIAVAIHPAGVVYVILVVPADIPVTIPEPEPISAMVVSPLVQIPPAVSSVNVPVKPTQMSTVPVIAAGNEFIETRVVAVQPVPN